MSAIAIETSPPCSLPVCLFENPYRLVSLLELMDVFRANDLLRVARDLHNEASLIFDSKSGPGYRLSAVESFKGTLQRFRALSEQYDLPMSALHASQIIESLGVASHILDASSSQRVATMLSVTLENELSLRVFLALPHGRKKLFDSPREGWEDVIERFPNSVSDIEEMTLCFALSRYAASVFHSVQVIEHGLIGLGDFLGVQDPQSGWTAVSNELRRIISRKYTERTAFESANFNFIEQVQGTVEALKNAWRNKISHATSRVKLCSDFTPDVAHEIVMASRAFMRRLAQDLPHVKE